MIRTTLLCCLYALFNVSGAAIIKWKVKERPLQEFGHWIAFLFTPQIIVAFALICVSALIMIKALSAGNFTYIVPVATGINFIFTIALGYFFFKESVNLISFLGFSLIISGIILLSLNKS